LAVKNIDAELSSGLDIVMKTKTPVLTLMLCVTAAAACFAADKKIEQALRDLDEQWSKAAGAKDLDKTVSYYADDAVVLPPNESAVTSKDGIRNLWKGFLDTVTSISWTATRVEMAKSGDMACLTGTYELTMKDGTKERGKYCEVWEKKGATWKCGTDIWNSDLPAAPSAEKK
jgi:ketosteroid isomerase-like protein